MTVVGSPALTPSRLGMMAVGGGTNYYSQRINKVVPSAGPLTMLVYMVKGPSVLYSNVLSADNNSNEEIGFSYWDAANRVAFARGRSSAYIDTASETTALAIGEAAVYLGTYDGATLRLYKNGKLNVSVASTNPNSDTNPRFVVGSGIRPANSATDGVLCAAYWTRVLTQSEILDLSNNPWGIFQAPPRKIWAGIAAGVQLLRPSSDITAGAWTPSSGATLFATINEVVANDATYDLTSQASTFEVGITAGTSPGVTTGHVVRYRIVGAVTVSLRQGTTTIASWSQSPAAMTTYVQTLTSLQAAAITNYAALSLQFQAV